MCVDGAYVCMGVWVCGCGCMVVGVGVDEGEGRALPHGGMVRVVSGHQAIHGYTLIRTQKIESYNIEFDYNW